MNRITFRPLVVSRLVLAAAAFALHAGCSEKGVVCHPVRGTMEWAGKPLAEANVTFHPQTPASAEFPRPVATTDEQGRFSLTTFKTGDGAPAGKYTITVELRQPRQVGEEIVRDGPNVLPPRYASPDTSPLSYEVTAGDNEIPLLRIER